MPEAEKLLSRMRSAKAGWGEKDLETLYTGFGFQYTEGKRHRKYFHPRYPQLFAHVGRHKSLAKGYITQAIKLIDQLKELEEKR